MATEIWRQLPIRVLDGAQPAMRPLARVEQPNSIARLIPSLNREFGQYSDETPVFAMARIVDDENSTSRRHAKIELVGEGWEKSGATDGQLGRVRLMFRNFFFKAQHRGIIVDENYTFGQLRQDCEQHIISTISGLGVKAESFLAGVIAKRPLQVLPGGLVAGE
jgi:hypothetical protein